MTNNEHLALRLGALLRCAFRFCFEPCRCNCNQAKDEFQEEIIEAGLGTQEARGHLNLIQIYANLFDRWQEGQKTHGNVKGSLAVSRGHF